MLDKRQGNKGSKSEKDFKKGLITGGVYHALLSLINAFSLLPAKDIPVIVNVGVTMPKLVDEINQQVPFFVEAIARGGRGFTGPLSYPNELLNWHMLPKKKYYLTINKLKELKKEEKEPELIHIN